MKDSNLGDDSKSGPSAAGGGTRSGSLALMSDPFHNESQQPEPSAPFPWGERGGHLRGWAPGQASRPLASETGLVLLLLCPEQPRSTGPPSSEGPEGGQGTILEVIGAPFRVVELVHWAGESSCDDSCGDDCAETGGLSAGLRRGWGRQGGAQEGFETLAALWPLRQLLAFCSGSGDTAGAGQAPSSWGSVSGAAGEGEK